MIYRYMYYMKPGQPNAKTKSRWANGRRGTRSASGPSSGSREWTNPDESGTNGGGPRGKRSQQRRQQQQHHSAALGAEPAVVQDSRPSRLLDTEFQVGGQRNLIYTPPPSVYDDDPGIMSEAETSATGFRRGNKVRQTLPVVRTPSKSQDRPLGPVSPQLRHENPTLGLVFLQYRSETKRALLPNEITTLDTVKALFVRSFPKQLTMEYLDSPHIRIYIHDPAKDMFYELEDLRDIRDRSVLRIYEQDVNGEGIYSTWEQELSYFSEPEFDSEYQNQHIHRAAKKNSALPPQDGYYGMSAYSPVVARAQTLPHHAAPNLRAFSPLPPEPRSKPPPPVMSQVAYAQTLPWGTHIVTYAAGPAPPPPPSPEKRPKEIIIPTGMMQPPPKPQRSFQQPPPIPPPMTSKGIRSTPPPTGPPPSIPSPRSTSVGRPPIVPERRHGDPQGAYNRPPPERPYSAGAQPIYSDRSAAMYGKSSAYHSPPSRYESGYLSSPERRYEPQRAFAAYPGPLPAAPAPASTTPYEEPYYGERIYGPSRSGSVTPVVDEEARMRVEYMERQLASLTGLVQKALSSATTPPSRPSPTPQSYHHQQQSQSQLVPTRDHHNRSDDYMETKSSKSSSNTSLADDMHESHVESSRYAFKEEKSVSFSDEATSTVSRQHHHHSSSPQHTTEKPTKPAIKSSSFSSRSLSSDVDPTSQFLPPPPTVKVTTADRIERESRSKPAPPPKPASLSSGSSCEGRSPPMRGKLRLSPELYGHLKHLKKQTKDLKLEVRNLRRIAQSQALTAKETVRETCLKIKTMLAAAQIGEEHVCAERLKVSREEDLYRQDVNHLEKDLLDLESQVEELRGNVINRKCRVNLADVEGMALILSRASKSVADLKARFPSLQDSLKTIMAVEMEVVVREEKFLKDEPERLENALRRCKKLTGTLVTLKRLASVQEQRHHTVGHHLPEKSHSAEGPYSDGEVHSAKGGGSFDGHTVIHVPPDGHQRRGETALDALLSELQTFNLPAEQKRDVIPGLLGPGRRLPSYPSADSPVRSPIHGYGPPSSKSPTPEVKTSNKLQVSSSGKSLSPTAQILTERKLSPTSLEVPSRTSPNLKQMVNGLDAPPPLAVKKVPPPPPPRTTSKSPMTSPTAAITTTGKQYKNTSRGPGTTYGRSSSVPSNTKIPEHHPTLRQTASARAPSREEPVKESEIIIRTSAINDDDQPRDQLSSNSSSSESVNSQEGVQAALQAAKLEQSRKAAAAQLIHSDDEVFKKQQQTLPRNRQELLEQRHQELLRKQKQLQEQYTRLQQMQRGQVFAKHSAKGDLKKTGSESNILSKASLSLTPASGSMQHLAITGSLSNPITGITINSTPNTPASNVSPATAKAHSAASKVFETDIL